MPTSTCRAKNPAVCRTHGFRVRAELFGGAGSVLDLFQHMKNRQLTPSRALEVLENVNRDNTNPRFSKETLDVATALLIAAQQGKNKNHRQLQDTRLTVRNIEGQLMLLRNKTLRAVEEGNLESEPTFEQVEAAAQKRAAGQPGYYDTDLSMDEFYDKYGYDNTVVERDPKTGIDHISRD